MPSSIDGHHLSVRQETTIELPLAGSGPIPFAPNKKHRHRDALIDRGGGLPTRRMVQQVDEGTVMARTVADLVHFLKERQRKVPGTRDATEQHGLHDHEVAQAHVSLSDRGYA